MGLFTKKKQPEVVKTYAGGKLISETRDGQGLPRPPLPGDIPGLEVPTVEQEVQQLQQPVKPRKEYIEPLKIPGLPIVLLLKIDEAGNLTVARV